MIGGCQSSVLKIFRKVMLSISVVCEVSKDCTAFILRVKQFKSTLCKLLHTEEGTMILGNINELFIQKQNITSQYACILMKTRCRDHGPLQNKGPLDTLIKWMWSGLIWLKLMSNETLQYRQ